MAVDLKKVPTTPGIYKFFNKSEIIYIGKAKNLKKRVSSYFGNSKKDSALGTNKFLAALSFLGSSTGLGLSIGALVTTMTGGTDFGLGLIIGFLLLRW